MGGAFIPRWAGARAGAAGTVLGGGTVEHVTWVGFTFDGMNLEVLPFLRTAVDGAAKIVAAIKQAA